tara:strand:- start:1176 stop:1799 length:624 start_codon:yes stop_codon:yes gene_type:complete
MYMPINASVPICSAGTGVGPCYLYYTGDEWAMSTMDNCPDDPSYKADVPQGEAESCPQDATWSTGDVDVGACSAPCGEPPCDNSGVYKAQICKPDDTQASANGAIIYVCEDQGTTGIISSHQFQTDGAIYVTYERCDDPQCDPGTQNCCAKVYDPDPNSLEDAIDYGVNGGLPAGDQRQATYKVNCTQPCTGGSGPGQGGKDCDNCT